VQARDLAELRLERALARADRRRVQLAHPLQLALVHAHLRVQARGVLAPLRLQPLVEPRLRVRRVLARLPPRRVDRLELRALLGGERRLEQRLHGQTRRHRQLGRPLAGRPRPLDGI